jgi:hypothetical protein
VKCGEIKIPENFCRGIIFPNYFFSGGGDATITGPLGAAERLTGRLGVNPLWLAKGTTWVPGLRAEIFSRAASTCGRAAQKPKKPRRCWAFSNCRHTHRSNKEKVRGIAQLFVRAAAVSKLVSVKYRCQTAKIPLSRPPQKRVSP